jgi:hypothetical protein
MEQGVFRKMGGVHIISKETWIEKVEEWKLFIGKWKVMSNGEDG